MRTYKNAGIKVFLFTGKDVDDYERMAALNPTVWSSITWRSSRLGRHADIA